MKQRKKRPEARWITNGKDDKFMIATKIDAYLESHPNWYRGSSKSKIKPKNWSEHMDKMRKNRTKESYEKLGQLMRTDWNPMKTKSGRRNNSKAQKSNRVMRIHAYCKLNNAASYQSKTEAHIVEYLSKYFEVIPQFFFDDDSHYYHNYDMLINLPNGIKLILEYDGGRHDSTYDHDRELVARSKGYEFVAISHDYYYNHGRTKCIKAIIQKYYPEFN